MCGLPVSPSPLSAHTRLTCVVCPRLWCCAGKSTETSVRATLSSDGSGRWLQAFPRRSGLGCCRWCYHRPSLPLRSNQKATLCLSLSLPSLCECECVCVSISLSLLCVYLRTHSHSVPLLVSLSLSFSYFHATSLYMSPSLCLCHLVSLCLILSFSPFPLSVSLFSLTHCPSLSHAPLALSLLLPLPPLLTHAVCVVSLPPARLVCQCKGSRASRAPTATSACSPSIALAQPPASCRALTRVSTVSSCRCTSQSRTWKTMCH